MGRLRPWMNVRAPDSVASTDRSPAANCNGLRPPSRTLPKYSLPANLTYQTDETLRSYKAH